MKVVQNEISFPSSFSIDHRFAPPPPTLTRKDNIIPSTEALSLNINMEKPRIPHHLAIRLYPRKSESRISVFRSFDHASRFLLSKREERETSRRETILAPPLSRKGQELDDKSKRNAVDVWDARALIHGRIFFSPRCFI